MSKIFFIFNAKMRTDQHRQEVCGGRKRKTGRNHYLQYDQNGNSFLVAAVSPGIGTWSGQINKDKSEEGLADGCAARVLIAMGMVYLLVLDFTECPANFKIRILD